uniref:KIB1-4 beta-propeller domain-containing protein n=1 Tax=Oryza punctata TaxID=4537 RepID=A0A0E0LH10_ORYPU
MDDEGAWSPWPDLQPELAGMVFCRLLSYGDRLRFRAVCRRWRLAARQQHPLPPALPWLNLDRITYQSLPDGEVHRIPVPDELPAGTVCRGSFDGWLLYDRSEQLECFLRNPISKAKIDLPYHWHCHEAILPDDEEGRHTMCFHESAVRRIVVCSPDLVVAAHVYLGLLFHRPSMHSTWSLADSPSTACNITLYRGKLYSISIYGELFVHEFSHHGHGDHVSSRFEIVIDTTPPEVEGWSTHYLVVSCTGKLLMVRWRWRLPNSYTMRRWRADELSKAINLDVFEADLEKRHWSEVKEIGDQALFVGTTCSKALPLPDHGNRIFFLGFDITQYCLGGIIHGIGDCAYCVYDMKNGTFIFDNPVSIKRERLSYGSEGNLSQRWRADWFFPSFEPWF